MQMKSSGMTAEVFLTAFRTLKRTEQDAFFGEMLKDRRLREDLIDIAIAEERSGTKPNRSGKCLKSTVSSWNTPSR